MTIIESNKLFYFYIKRDNNIILGNRPLLLIEGENNKKMLTYLRDVDFMVEVEENEFVRIGVVYVDKSKRRSLVKFINKEPTEDVHKMFEEKIKIHIINKKKFLNTDRGEIHLDFTGMKIDLTCINAMDLNEKSYYMMNPGITLKNSTLF